MQWLKNSLVTAICMLHCAAANQASRLSATNANTMTFNPQCHALGADLLTAKSNKKNFTIDSAAPSTTPLCRTVKYRFPNQIIVNSRIFPLQSITIQPVQLRVAANIHTSHWLRLPDMIDEAQLKYTPSPPLSPAAS